MQNIDVTETIDPAAKREAWFKIIEDYQSSGDSQVGYCRQHNINKDHFGYYLSRWRAKHANESAVKSATFLEMQVVDAAQYDKWVLKIADDMSIEIPHAASMKNLAELIINLRNKAC